MKTTVIQFLQHCHKWSWRKFKLKDSPADNHLIKDSQSSTEAPPPSQSQSRASCQKVQVSPSPASVVLRPSSTPPPPICLWPASWGLHYHHQCPGSGGRHHLHIKSFIQCLLSSCPGSDSQNKKKKFSSIICLSVLSDWNKEQSKTRLTIFHFQSVSFVLSAHKPNFNHSPNPAH